MDNRLKRLMDELDVRCEQGREGFLVKALLQKLSEASFKELVSLISTYICGFNAEGPDVPLPSETLKGEIRLLKGKIESGLRGRANTLSPETDAFLSYMQLRNDPGFKDLSKYLLLVAVDAGHPGAMLEQAKNSKEPHQREYWLLKAMHKGSAEATYRLARFYGDFGNFERYHDLLQKARHMGHAEARYEYISDFMEHTDCSKEVFGTMLRDMEDLANEYHHVKAMTKVAFHYGDSTCPYYDLDKAISYWERSANPDNPESCYYLAMHYRQLGEEVEEAGNKDEANRFYNLAIKYARYGFEKHEPFCGRQLGFVYMNLERYEESYDVFKTLSDEGDGRSTRTLGLFYSKGLGRDEDWGKALPFFEKAVEQGYKSAEYDIGLSLEILGRVGECVDHYVLALEAGYTFAAKHLADLLDEGTILAKDVALAKQLREYYEQIEGQAKPFWD